jgi:predicted outer membrane protein
MMRKPLVATAAAVGLILCIPVAQAQDVPNTPEHRAMEYAKQGPEALRRFILRTRMIYNLNFRDFYKSED